MSVNDTHTRQMVKQLFEICGVFRCSSVVVFYITLDHTWTHLYNAILTLRLSQISSIRPERYADGRFVLVGLNVNLFIEFIREMR